MVNQAEVFDAIRYAQQHLKKYDFKSVVGHASSVDSRVDDKGRITSVMFTVDAASKQTVEVDPNGAVRWRQDGELHRDSNMPAAYGKHYTHYFEHGKEVMCLDEKGMIRQLRGERWDTFGRPAAEA